MEMKKKEINILGAGISGLACAIILRKKGYVVNVYEKQSTGGTRFNNDWQGIENWSEDIDVLRQMESYGIDISFYYEPIDALYFHFGNKNRLMPIKNGAYLVRRGKEEGCLDTSLLAQAKEAGVNVYFNCCKLKDIPIIDVNATGPKKASGLVRGIKFKTKSPDSCHFAFGEDIAKGFYSYLLIKKGYGTIATVFNKKYAYNADNFLNNTINLFSEYTNRKELEKGKKFGGYGHFEIKKNLRDENGALLIGEAGGFQDYFWGFGMRYAIQTAYFAARSIMYNEPYEELIGKHVTQKMKHSLRNRRTFEFMGKLAYPLAYYLLTKSKQPLKILKSVY